MMTDNYTSSNLVLLIEDNDEHAELAMFYIQEHDPSIQVHRLIDGEQALRYIEAADDANAEKPWLIFLDLKLPKYDGHEVLTKIKSSQQLSCTPIVVFTTSASKKEIRSAMLLGANSFVNKPMEADQYPLIITQILNYWRMNQSSSSMD